MNCRLCLSNNELESIIGADNREYLLCNNCMLVNAYPDSFPEKEEEKKRYLTHNNGMHNSGYVNFLSGAVNPALQYLSKEMIGLDYGCGYAPTLSKILKQRGYRCENYDPIFIKHRLNKKFDFIFSTEVFEHFFHPLKEIKKLVNLLKQDGFLIIMTERWKNRKQFRDWYYVKDPTHVAFYHNSTFDFICNNYAFEKLYDDNNRIIILRKV